MAWLKSAVPDVVLLQEIKCLDEEVPRMEIESLGYQVSAVGMKARHGVALLSKRQAHASSCAPCPATTPTNRRAISKR